MARKSDKQAGTRSQEGGSATSRAAPCVDGRTSILVVEEQEAARAAEISCFERIGCIVHSAGDLQEALQEARTATLDIALVSEACLGEDSGQACESIREACGRSDLPVVLISDEDAPESIDLSRARGCCDYVPRSVSQMELVRRVANILQIPPRRFLRTMVAQADTDLRSKVEYLGHSRDISRTGIMIETDRPMALDQVVTIKFLLPHSNSLINATAQVIRVLRNPLSGQYEVGCRFTEITPAAEKTITDYLHHDTRRS